MTTVYLASVRHFVVHDPSLEKIAKTIGIRASVWGTRSLKGVQTITSHDEAPWLEYWATPSVWATNRIFFPARSFKQVRIVRDARGYVETRFVLADRDPREDQYEGVIPSESGSHTSSSVHDLA
ncbi:hypothetical protein CTA1_504 [Colletotrichum tanaceti]|uniref:Uncharacterized protein n=1 Tax=Colletotrichum tanaceti TaxID=1306861 RepID=A0A4U6XGL1_9PEZI|nr:hypothetical protein CTA1_504 [Colletotrichum tanaceti]